MEDWELQCGGASTIVMGGLALSSRVGNISWQTTLCKKSISAFADHFLSMNGILL